MFLLLLVTILASLAISLGADLITSFAATLMRTAAWIVGKDHLALFAGVWSNTREHSRHVALAVFGLARLIGPTITFISAL